MQPKVCVLRTDGTNCDEETAFAFQKAGGSSHLVHINQLREGSDSLLNYQVLAIPGGFSDGDDLGAGVVLGHELISFLRDQLQAFVDRKRLILGICNGFQVLVQTGLLPFGKMGERQAALTTNKVGRFDCRWIELDVWYDSPCVFTQGMTGRVFHLPVAHGEGRFVIGEQLRRELHERKLASLRYVDHGHPAACYPANPNGSVDGTAGVCDPSGCTFGLMPHPERFVEITHHPNWRRFNYGKPHGLPIFENAITYARSL